MLESGTERDRERPRSTYAYWNSVLETVCDALTDARPVNVIKVLGEIVNFKSEHPCETIEQKHQTIERAFSESLFRVRFKKLNIFT